jgi:hypothetical protein
MILTAGPLWPLIKTRTALCIDKVTIDYATCAPFLARQEMLDPKSTCRTVISEPRIDVDILTESCSVHVVLVGIVHRTFVHAGTTSEGAGQAAVMAAVFCPNGHINRDGWWWYFLRNLNPCRLILGPLHSVLSLESFEIVPLYSAE